MGASRTSGVAFVAVVAVVLLFLPAASAGQPVPLDLNPDEMNALATDVGVDDRGRYAGAVIETQPTDRSSFARRDNLHVYRLPDETKDSAFSQPDPPTTSHRQTLAVPDAGGSGAEVFAVGGADGKVFLFDRTATEEENPVRTHQKGTHRVRDVAIGPDGRWIVAAFEDLTAQGGQLVTMEVTQDGLQTHSRDLPSSPTAVAIAPEAPASADTVILVGTRADGVRFHFDRTLSGNTFSRSTNRVVDVALSNSGRYAAVGTAATSGGSAGALHYLGRKSSGDGYADSYDSFVSRFDDPAGSVTDVALTDGGRYVTAGDDNGRIRFLQNPDTSDPSRHTATIGATLTGLGGPVDDLETSDDGRYVLAAVGGDLHAFTRATGERLWSLETPGDLEHAAVAGNGARFVAAANADGTGSVYGWRHRHDVEVDVQPATPVARPEQTVDVTAKITNTGSNVGTFTLVLNAPKGWSLSQAVRDRVILPGRSANLTVSVTPRERAAAGTHDIAYQVLDGEAGVISDSGTFPVRVPAVEEIRVGKPERTREVDAGSETVVDVGVTNAGNRDIRVAVSRIGQDPTTSGQWDVRALGNASGSGIRLASGETGSIPLSIRAPGDAPDGASNRITLELASAEATAEATVIARVNPRYGFDASVTPDPLEIPGGGRGAADLTLRNTGNTRVYVDIEGSLVPQEATRDWALDPVGEDGRVTLDSGTTSTEEVAVRAVKETPEAATVLLRLDSSGNETEVLQFKVQRPLDDEGAPAPGLPALISALAGALVLRRRRS